MQHMRRLAFWSKEDHARTYRKGAWAALNDRGDADKIFLKEDDYMAISGVTD